GNPPRPAGLAPIDTFAGKPGAAPAGAMAAPARPVTATATRSRSLRILMRPPFSGNSPGRRCGGPGSGWLFREPVVRGAVSVASPPGLVSTAQPLCWRWPPATRAVDDLNPTGPTPYRPHAGLSGW